MQIQLTVDGNEVPTYVESNALQIVKALSSRNSTATFSIRIPLVAGVPDGSVYVPQNFSQVVMTNLATGAGLFTGFVTQINKNQMTADYQRWDCSCVGLEYLLENTICDTTTLGVNDGAGTITWSGVSDQQMIQDIFTNNLPQITTTSDTVQAVALDLDFQAKDQSLKSILDTLSGLSGSDWRVREDSALLWYASGSISAPFGFGNPGNISTS